MLRDLVALLKQFNVTYWLGCGTLLGAYRHGALLPWDDDVDIVIPREQRHALRNGDFRRQAAGLQLHVQNGVFCNAEQYVAAVAYLKRYVRHNASRLDFNELYDDCSSSIGFFSRVTRWHEREELRVHVDLWHAFPVTLGNKTLFSYGGSAWLFSRRDVYPLQPCWLGGDEYTCPARTRLWLARDYKSLSFPWLFDDARCKLVEQREGGVYRAKWATTSVKAFPEVPQLALDLDHDDVLMHVPQQYLGEVSSSSAGISSVAAERV